MIRLFVAVPLPEEIQDRVAELCSGLANARWIDHDNFHITLRFIGEVAESRFDDLDMALSAVHAPAFRLKLNGVDSFGNNNGVRAVWVGVAREPALFHLRDKVESALVRAGVPPEGQKFKPHVTLTRSRQRGDARLGDFIARNSLFQAGPFEVSEFTLFSSFLSQSGSIYTPERVYPLTGTEHPHPALHGR
ncbi:MAG TPA: RNA 2',3'-cyclic phosphodiesterase [Alphaproteobacteria bacterium]|nr:RNA 2',3'-cyclic phosphodiesterase [Alphaproteobacteria bacterium]